MLFDKLAAIAERFDKTPPFGAPQNVSDRSMLLLHAIRRAAIFEVQATDVTAWMDAHVADYDDIVLPLNPVVFSIRHEGKEVNEVSIGCADLGDEDFVGQQVDAEASAWKLVFLTQHQTAATDEYAIKSGAHIFSSGDPVVTVVFALMQLSSKGFTIESPILQIATHELDTKKVVVAWTDKGEDNWDAQKDELRYAAGSLVSCLQMVASPHRWIVERINEHARPIQKGRIARSDQRPRYLTVSEHELHKKLRISSGVDSEVLDRASHRRRAHKRLLSSQRYKRRGEYVTVKACWVGPDRWQNKHEIYRVLVDK